MVMVMSLLINAGSGLGFRFEVRAWTEMEIWCIKGMFMLKVVAKKLSETLEVNPYLLSLGHTFPLPSLCRRDRKGWY